MQLISAGVVFATLKGGELATALSSISLSDFEFLALVLPPSMNLSVFDSLAPALPIN